MSDNDHSKIEGGPPTAGSLQTRREFLRTTILGSAACWTMPLFLERTFSLMGAEAAQSMTQLATGKDGPILVVLQLAGGNDGLNTVIPYADDEYYKHRPRLAIPATDVLKLNDHVGFHPNMAGMRDLLEAGELSVLQGVGYPNPNRSHFRSTEIWHTAADSDRNEPYGWLGRYFDNACEGMDPSVGIALVEQRPQAFLGRNPTGITFTAPEEYRWFGYQGEGADDAAAFFEQLNVPDDGLHTEDGGLMAGASIGSIGGSGGGEGDHLSFLQRTALDAQLSSEQITEVAKGYHSKVEYPGNNLGQNLRLIAQMIAGGLPSRVYYASQGGYDTHQGQEYSHQRLLGELSASVTAFCQDLKEQGNFDRVLLMTFSEFGRRVRENGSAGTDHGAAAPLFLAGGAIRGGLTGAHPSLTELHRGDLVHSIDFRSVYATILEHWLQTPAEKVLGRKFPTLEFI